MSRNSTAPLWRVSILVVLCVFLSPSFGFEGAEHKHAGDWAFSSLREQAEALCPHWYETVQSGNGQEKVDGTPIFTFSNGDGAISVTYGDMVGLAGDFFAEESPLSLIRGRADRSNAARKQYRELAFVRGGAAKLAHEILSVFKAEIETLTSMREKRVRCQEKVLKSKKCRDDHEGEKCQGRLARCYDMFKPRRAYDEGGLIDLYVMERKSEGRLLTNALRNYDHFGWYAVRAYKTMHMEAVDQAVFAASYLKSGNTKIGCEMLEDALAANAFADHYLSDLFAAGHIRTPRLELEMACSSSRNMALFNALNLRHTIGSAPTKAMHDEDNENGLHVTNLEGESWIAYGDKVYFAERNDNNREMLHKALMASIKGVLDVASASSLEERAKFSSANLPALRHVPILTSAGPDDAFAQNNPYPMFFLFNGLIYQRASKDPYLDTSGTDGMPSFLENPYSWKNVMTSCNPLSSPKRVKLRPALPIDEFSSRRLQFRSFFLTGESLIPNARSAMTMKLMNVSPFIKRNMVVSLKSCEKGSTPITGMRVSARFYSGSSPNNDSPRAVGPLLRKTLVDSSDSSMGLMGVPSNEKVNLQFEKTSWLRLYNEGKRDFSPGSRDTFKGVQANDIGDVVSKCEVVLMDSGSWSKWCPGVLTGQIPTLDENGELIVKEFTCDFGCACLRTDDVLSADAVMSPEGKSPEPDSHLGFDGVRNAYFASMADSPSKRKSPESDDEMASDPSDESEHELRRNAADLVSFALGTHADAGAERPRPFKRMASAPTGVSSFDAFDAAVGLGGMSGTANSLERGFGASSHED